MRMIFPNIISGKLLAKKDELRLVHFPNIKITFEDLFDEIDY